MLRGSRMVYEAVEDENFPSFPSLWRPLNGTRLRPNPAKQAPVSQHRKCKTRTDMATRVSALEAGGCSGRVSSGLAEACRAEIEEDMIWSKDYASVESGLAVSLRSEQGGSVSLFWLSGLMLAQPMSSTGLEWASVQGGVEGKQGRRAKIAGSKIKGRMIRVTRVLILLGLPDRSRQDLQGNPRLADCRLWMRGFGDDCDSLAGLVVLSHKPALERLLKRERMAESRERNKEIACGLVGWKETGWNWASGCPWREKRMARQPNTRAVQANDTMDMPGVRKEWAGGATGARGAGTSQICRRRQSHTTLLAALYV
ncbi:hypothetical protein GE21DRAFT_4219 [Neurospora crassa]|uniref:Uncharacterized protein n=1 Tax=Neurospora crassa (strain ATCC 24698 / 74-OR23-1A / CBS 708.71 / DSM 1257 / FGSC 987) TaxID=367110 RepID=Q7SBS0_NEUCR|nr:hypothetical protein NCU06236 [Neurospora crassa OR74A]EAA33851.2 hypothetical protein NCU06236 [Neurospora crassa OR74A]KHE87072.1 hypothetical protein GE21DRAFT_4219 [Neurospora crassa]|eukprot:XP_963087.2 hypothetical protein NCU06236 [Neurospora crassa OR74A]